MWIDAAVRALFRWRVPVTLALVVALATAAWLARGLSFDFTPQRIFVSDHEDYRRLERAHQVFGRDDSSVLVHLAGDSSKRPSASGCASPPSGA